MSSELHVQGDRTGHELFLSCKIENPIFVVVKLSLAKPSLIAGPIWIDNLDCARSHDTLSECDFNEWGVNNCDHDEDIGVICWAGVKGSFMNY